MSAILPAPGIAREHLSGFQLDLLSAHGNTGGPIFDPATGKVFGVLKGGPVDPKGNLILEITTAEPVYPAFDQGLIEKLLAHAIPAPQERKLSTFQLREPALSDIKAGHPQLDEGAMATNKRGPIAGG